MLTVSMGAAIKGQMFPLPENVSEHGGHRFHLHLYFLGLNARLDDVRWNTKGISSCLWNFRCIWFPHRALAGGARGTHMRVGAVFIRRIFKWKDAADLFAPRTLMTARLIERPSRGVVHFSTRSTNVENVLQSQRWIFVEDWRYGSLKQKHSWTNLQKYYQHSRKTEMQMQGRSNMSKLGRLVLLEQTDSWRTLPF